MKKYTYNGIELTPQNGYVTHPVTTITYPVSWTEMGDIVIEDLPEPEPVAPEPQYKTTYTPLEYLELFTPQEQLAVVSATLANAQVKLWYDKMLAASVVDITDPRTVAGLDALVGVGLIAATRKAEILTPVLL